MRSRQGLTYKVAVGGNKVQKVWSGTGVRALGDDLLGWNPMRLSNSHTPSHPIIHVG